MKKIGIMQPYFFPYIGYISLIKHTDQFILFDPVQFIRHGWIERNRVLKQDGEWLYIKVPLIKSPRETLIKDMRIDNSTLWKQKILSQLQPYKKIAPYYDKVIDLIDTTFDNKCDSIVALNKATLEAICRYLGIHKSLDIFSELNLEIKEPKAPDEWALNICLALGGVSEYWNPPGGEVFFNKLKYDTAGIALKFQKVHIEQYSQKRSKFEPGLSIIDVMMFNSPEDINLMLDNYDLT